MNKRLLAVVVLAAAASGCAVNPVTGKPDFMVVSEAQELAIGAQNYAPMQQAEGGIYDIDPELTAYVSEVGSKLADNESQRYVGRSGFDYTGSIWESSLKSLLEKTLDNLSAS